MIWSTNYGRLASQTLFTFFFAGREFAPKCVIDGQNIQDYLQSHYIAAFAQLAERIRDAGGLLDECILGWDSMNEPFEGFCTYEDLNKVPTKQGSTLKKGPFPTPAQSLRLGMGTAQTVECWKFTSTGPKRDGTITIDPRGLRMWADPESEPDGAHPRWGWRRDPGWKLGTCVWAQHGVWDGDSGVVLVPDYFRRLRNGQDFVFIDEFWRPHWQTFATRMRQSHPEAILFVAPPVFAPPPQLDERYLKGRCCLSTHYYDGLTLVSRHWNWFNADALGLIRGKYSSTVGAVRVGERAIRKSLQEQLGYLKADAKILGEYPTIIGEIGVPYDMDGKKSYGWTDDGKYKGDYSNQQKALDASLNAADGPNGLNYTIWTYCPDSSHQWGDGWNMEDLSLWSSDDLTPSAQFRMGSADSSSAFLLKKDKASVQTSAATSSLSLPTLGGGVDTLSDGDTVVSSRPTPRLLTDYDNIYDFLTDGARAPKAFSRPYPAAVVGVPTDIQFDIAKAEFKLTVRVRPEDAPAAARLGLPASVGADADEAELPTEIFVPLVHYASDRVLASAQGEDSAPPSPVIGAERTDLLGQLIGGASLLALNVELSVGRWTIDGQTLKWWYPVPASGPPREYTITIRRAGGAIKSEGEAVAASSCSGASLLGWCLDECCTVM